MLSGLVRVGDRLCSSSCNVERSVMNCRGGRVGRHSPVDRHSALHVKYMDYMSELVPIQTDDDYGLHFRLHTYNVYIGTASVSMGTCSMCVRGWTMRVTVCSACLPPTHTQHAY